MTRPMGDRRTFWLNMLLWRVEAIVDSEPSLDALYALESSLLYSDFWHEVYAVLHAGCETRGMREAWRVELLCPPPNPVMWLSFLDRKESSQAALQDAARRWTARGPHRMFIAHHHVPGILEGIAAVHITLLANLDPVGAVEYVAGLSSEFLVWPTERRIRLHEQPALIDRVLSESCVQDAVLLSLACEFDAHCLSIDTLEKQLRWFQGTEASAPAQTALDEAWSSMPERYHQLSTALMQRTDAGCLVGPWIRHLVSCADRTMHLGLDASSRVAMTALKQMLAAVPEGSPVELGFVDPLDATMLVARMLFHTRVGRGAQDWQEWEDLLVAENDSLRSCSDVAWQAAAEALLRMAAPRTAWMQTARALQPVLRRRARSHSSNVDPVLHLIMAGLYAAVHMEVDAAAQWWSLFELALRQFLTDRPAVSDPSYRLCAHVFAAFPRIFSDPGDFHRALCLLPTAAHVEWARETLVANGGSMVGPNAQ